MKILGWKKLAAVTAVAACCAITARAQDLREVTDAGGVKEQPGAVARLSPSLRPKEIRRAMRRVADWQLREAEQKFSTDWTYAALYDGLLAASRATGDRRYREAVQRFAEHAEWKLGPRFAHADDEAVGQAYADLYLDKPDPLRIAALRAEADKLLARTDDPAKPLWWWCDALFMAPPALARLAKATGDRRYLDYMDREWTVTETLLYDRQDHLFSRDATYLDKHEANGRKLYWSRGNGWVMGGLVRVLEELPAGDPLRPRYERVFKEMATSVKALQGEDGLWRSGLLDAASYTAPEVSGSAFFTFALAWGIRQGLLPRAEYLPVVERAWRGMLEHVYADGRLGSIQRVGAAPDSVRPGGSYVYGVGAFLLAGEELEQMNRGKKR